MVSTFARAFACVVLSAAACAARAEDPVKVYRIGILIPFSDEALAKRLVPVQAPFEEGMRERGWIEGRNVQLLYRNSRALDELIRLPVDVLVTMGNEYGPALRATTTMPIVALMDAAVQQGTVKSLAHPGANLTGISVESQGSLATKRLSILKEATGASRVARLYVAEKSTDEKNLRFGTDKDMLPEYAIAARTLGIEIVPVWAPTPEDLRGAFAELKRRGIGAIMVGAFSRLPGLEPGWDALLEQIERHRMPALFDVTRAVNQGGLMSYGDNIPDRARRLAYFVDRILRGAKPGELPVEQTSNFELVVNLKAAEKIGMKIPASVLLQADRVIR